MSLSRTAVAVTCCSISHFISTASDGIPDHMDWAQPTRGKPCIDFQRILYTHYRPVASQPGGGGGGGV